ncbi:hypothetical protein [uncultured Tenacibaculum sp.]|uniref:hypothetical protein n=1 Tax=uncultured Tenacibaculum sp. TaxID=174713 RepID=UPI002633F2FA|nr:hypothetical protein [uncultured Tenacibaculum sp.]
MNKLKVVHIHTDYKFVYNSLMFEDKEVENCTIVIEKTKKYNVKGENKKIKTYLNNEKDFAEIIEFCKKNANLVVLYNLDLLKSRIALKLPSDIKIAWRFFGVELYSLNKSKFISRISFNKGIDFKEKFKIELKNSPIIDKIYRFFSGKEDFKRIFKEAVNRIDLVLMLSEEEYNHLDNNPLRLPKFIKLPHIIREDIEDYSDHAANLLKEKIKYRENSIIVGNSRSIYNNHLDVIDIIEKYSSKKNKFIFLFNYGTLGVYTDKVLARLSNKANVEVINDFLPKDEFIKFYRKPVALVINSYRQLAWDNIRLALKNGVKVYLNDKNIHKSFLVNEGFKIFSMQDFKNDLKNDNLSFDKECAAYNINNFVEFAKNYSKLDFIKNLKAAINS